MTKVVITAPVTIRSMEYCQVDDGDYDTPNDVLQDIKQVQKRKEQVDRARFKRARTGLTVGRSNTFRKR